MQIDFLVQRYPYRQHNRPKKKKTIIVNRFSIDFSYLDIFVVRQRLAESIIQTRSSNRHAVTIVYHQNLCNEIVVVC